jgi:hypothetical protein
MKDFKIYIFVASALLIIYLLIQYNSPREIDWSATLLDNQKKPFDTYVLYHQLNDIFPKASVKEYREPIYNVLTDHGIKHATYVIIADDVTDIGKEDYEKLTGFIKNGNDVFISASYFGGALSKELKIEWKSDLKPEGNNVAIRFLNHHLDTAYHKFDNNLMSSNYFEKLDTGKAIALGENSFHHVNFLKFPMGKGNLYLHANPLVFSNYSLLNQDARYAGTALSYLKNDSNILWDGFYSQGRGESESVMRVFLKYRPLRNAFYIALVSLLVFVIYEKKRRQRIIPVLKPLTNTSVEFVNVVGQVYYEQRNNRNIAQKKTEYFLEQLRGKYNLKTTVLDANFRDTLAKKCGVSEVFIHDIVNQIIRIRSSSYVSDTQLINLNKSIEQFYLQSR